MTSTTDFNPEMLSLARQTRQLTMTRLAKLVGVKVATISKYESGTMETNPDRLSKIAEVLDYPVTFFCRKPTLIGTSGGSVFHRKQQSLPAKKLYQSHALAEVRRLEIGRMLDSLDVQIPPPVEYDVELFEDNPEKIARSVRTAMNIPPGPIFNITETLERNSYIVVAHDFGSRQIDGFSQRPPHPPHRPCFLHINSELPPDRWRWTLAHELGHLVMHFNPMESPKLAETQADRFAAELLTPAHEIGHELDGLTFQKLSALKRSWKVSMQSLITRAYHLGTISAGQRRSMFIRLSSAGYRKREPETLDPPVERPTIMTKLAQKHLDELEFSRSELCDFLMIGEADLKRYYVSESDDILETLGIDDILRNQ